MKQIPVYTEADEERFTKVLREIQNSIPPLLRRNASSSQKLTPTIEMVMNKALESETISEEKKTQIRHLLESGQFSKTSVQENPQVTKQIDNYVSREINKAIRAGRLPPKGHTKYLPSVLKMKNEEKTN
jgi:hypothetical protein